MDISKLVPAGLRDRVVMGDTNTCAVLSHLGGFVCYRMAWTPRGGMRSQTLLAIGLIDYNLKAKATVMETFIIRLAFSSSQISMNPDNKNTIGFSTTVMWIQVNFPEFE